MNKFSYIVYVEIVTKRTSMHNGYKINYLRIALLFSAAKDEC